MKRLAIFLTIIAALCGCFCGSIAAPYTVKTASAEVSNSDGVAAYRAYENALFGSMVKTESSTNITGKKFGFSAKIHAQGTRFFRADRAESEEITISEFAEYACKKTCDNRSATFCAGKIKNGEIVYGEEVFCRKNAFKGVYGALASALTKFNLTETSIISYERTEGDGIVTHKYTLDPRFACGYIAVEMCAALKKNKNIEFTSAFLTLVTAGDLPEKAISEFAFNVDLLGGIECEGRIEERFFQTIR